MKTNSLSPCGLPALLDPIDIDPDQSQGVL
jgi:hypothetical protein